MIFQLEPLQPIDISDGVKLAEAMEKAGIANTTIEACKNGVCEL
jgi:hypothetical protein